jgi:hypothetical protein
MAKGVINKPKVRGPSHGGTVSPVVIRLGPSSGRSTQLLEPPFADRSSFELAQLARDCRAKAFIASTEEMQRALTAVTTKLERAAEERQVTEVVGEPPESVCALVLMLLASAC